MDLILEEFPVTFDAEPVFIGNGYILNDMAFFGNAVDGSTSSLDLTIFTPIVYRVSKYEGEILLEKSLPDGQTETNGFKILGDDNNQLEIEVGPSEIAEARTLLHRHELFFVRELI